jgi:hypothetical protein
MTEHWKIEFKLKLDLDCGQPFSAINNSNWRDNKHYKQNQQQLFKLLKMCHLDEKTKYFHKSLRPVFRTRVRP